MTESYKTQVIRAHVLNELFDYIEDKRGSGTTLAMADLTNTFHQIHQWRELSTSSIQLK